MEKRIAAFCSDKISTVVHQVNAFLTATEGSLHDVLYQHELTEDKFDYSIILIYTPKGGSCEEREKREAESKEGNGRIQGRISTQRFKEGAQGRIQETSCCYSAFGSA